jgi:hypothetical protein
MSNIHKTLTSNGFKGFWFAVVGRNRQIYAWLLPRTLPSWFRPPVIACRVALKNKYDPINFFRLNQNIKPSQATLTAMSA